MTYKNKKINLVNNIFLPEKDVSIMCLLTEEEVKQRIKRNILLKEKLVSFPIRNNSIFWDFEGYVKNSEFFIRRIFKYPYDSFIPLICGFIEQEDTDITKINMNITFQKVTKFILVIFYFFEFFLFLLDIWAGNLFSIGSLIILFVVFIQIFILNIIFNKEYKKVEDFIKYVFTNGIDGTRSSAKDAAKT